MQVTALSSPRLYHQCASAIAKDQSSLRVIQIHHT